MSFQNKVHTTTEFWAFVNLPENSDRFFELIRGEIVETGMTAPYYSALSAKIAMLVSLYTKQHSNGHITGADGGYNLSDDTTVAPDVSFISKARQPTLPTTGLNPLPPDLAVEVISPSDLNNPQQRIQDKIAVYREAKIPLLWLVYPNQQEIAVYVRGEFTQTLGIEDIVDGGEVLPQFSVAIKAVFA